MSYYIINCSYNVVYTKSCTLFIHYHDEEYYSGGNDSNCEHVL